MTVETFSDDTFEQEVLRVAEPVVVDFFAEWCGPCRAMAPALDQAAEELTGKVKIVKVDVDKCPTISAKYSVRAMPTLLILKGGTVVSRRTGSIPQKAKLLEWITSASEATDVPPEPRAEEFKLANGLHVVVLANTRATSVAMATSYRVGTADDAVGARMFAMLSAGFPTPDTTVLRQSVGKDELQGAMEKDAARMSALDISDDDLATARQKLDEWLARVGSSPSNGIEEQMRIAMYGSHPYASSSAGSEDSVSNLSRDDLVRFHQRHCAPNNAVIVVCGAVTLEEVKALVEKAYGQIPFNPDIVQRVRRPPRVPQAVQPFTGTSQRVKKGVLLRRFVVPSRASAEAGEAEALAILTQILNGPGRLALPAVGDARPEFIAQSKYIGDNLGRGEFVFQARECDPEATGTQIERLIDDIRTNGVTEDELASAKGRLAADDAIANYDENSIAARYDAVALGISISCIERRAATVAKVTADDVLSVAGKYLDPQHAVTGWLLPEAATLAEVG